MEKEKLILPGIRWDFSFIAHKDSGDYKEGRRKDLTKGLEKRKMKGMGKTNYMKNKLPKNWHILNTPARNRKRSRTLKRLIKEGKFIPPGVKNKGKHLSEVHKIAISKGYKGHNKGKKNWQWKGGKSRKHHNKNKRYRQWRMAVFMRDNWTCQFCGKRGGIDLEPHHIKEWAKYPKLRYSVENGITLCKECHKLTY